MEFEILNKKEAVKRRESNNDSKMLHDLTITEETETSYSGFCKTCDCVHSVDKLIDLNTRYQREMGIVNVDPLPDHKGS